MSHYLRNLPSGLPAIAGEDDCRIGFLGISPIYHIKEQPRILLVEMAVESGHSLAVLRHLKSAQQRLCAFCMGSRLLSAYGQAPLGLEGSKV